MSHPHAYGGHETPTTRPQQPTVEPPSFALPPSLPKQSFFDHNDDLDNGAMPPARRGSAWEQQPVARSLTNNDHGSYIPSGSMVKMGQSPTILSILSTTDQTNTTGGGMSYSSRTYASTTVPQQQQNQHNSFSPQPQQYNQQNTYFGQYPPPQPIQQGNEEEDEDMEMDIEHENLQFDFTLEE